MSELSSGVGRVVHGGCEEQGRGDREEQVADADDGVQRRKGDGVVRLRTKVNRGAGSRIAALAMVFKLVESAQRRWRAVNAPHLVALVRAGARFEGGQLVERPTAMAA
ncbi:hypothetical protein K1Y78_40795 [Streptomyces sp. tea 10]|nr:hypothetical protein [Streptomyces sp. tea 10]